MGDFSTTILKIARNVYRRAQAEDQGGLLDGQDPSIFDPSDPLRLWIIQLGIIILTSQLLSLALRKIRQPKVISEVIGGIILGPTLFGRIPGFTEHIFPQVSRPYLSLTADIGLCLFLFLVGLEIDTDIIRRNARLSVTIALAGMCLPFGLGAALSVPLYHTFIPSTVKFTNFMLFTGVAYSITAFPVLCRILTELKLLDTTVGIVVLSAGVGNDIVGWILLALSVALVNAGSGITALYILLICVGWTLVLLFPVRKAMYWLAKRTGSTHNGPTMFFMTVTILVVFGSAFFTDIIGVQAIFGAFLAGLVIPREGGLAISLTEKLEDFVSIIFLPLYFTLSGLSTDLGLLNNGITWGYTVAICTLAYSGKFGGCTLAARFIAKFGWRESATIGSLMSCKGLVELIVLNVGLSAGILTPQVFSMFVLEALLLTFMTTPAVLFLYPPKYRTRLTASGVPFASVTGHDNADTERDIHPSRRELELDREKKTRFTVILDRLEHMPAMMALAQLIQSTSYQGSDSENTDSGTPKAPLHEVSIDALRLIELSDRTSAVMKSSNVDMLRATDPLLDIFSTFGDLNGIPVSTSLSVVTYAELARSVAEHATWNRSQLVLLPWCPARQVPQPTEPGEARDAEPATPKPVSYNPFEALFDPAGMSPSAHHAEFIRAVFAECKTNVALYLDRHHPGESTKFSSNSRQHLFLPFFGGPDDRLALDFVVQLCASAKVSATVVRVARSNFDPTQRNSIEKPQMAHVDDRDQHPGGLTVASTTFPDTVYGHESTQTRLQSETADSIIWGRYTTSAAPDSPLAGALSRIEFVELPTPSPLRTVVEYASRTLESAGERRTKMLVVVGRSRRLATENHHTELQQMADEYGGARSEIRKTVGDVAMSFVLAGSKASIVVLQAADVSVD